MSDTRYPGGIWYCIQKRKGIDLLIDELRPETEETQEPFGLLVWMNLKTFWALVHKVSDYVYQVLV